MGAGRVCASLLLVLAVVSAVAATETGSLDTLLPEAERLLQKAAQPDTLPPLPKFVTDEVMQPLVLPSLMSLDEMRTHAKRKCATYFMELDEEKSHTYGEQCAILIPDLHECAPVKECVKKPTACPPAVKKCVQQPPPECRPKPKCPPPRCPPPPPHCPPKPVCTPEVSKCAEGMVSEAEDDGEVDSSTVEATSVDQKKIEDEVRSALKTGNNVQASASDVVKKMRDALQRVDETKSQVDSLSKLPTADSDLTATLAKSAAEAETAVAEERAKIKAANAEAEIADAKAKEAIAERKAADAKKNLSEAESKMEDAEKKKAAAVTDGEKKEAGKEAAEAELEAKKDAVISAKDETELEAMKKNIDNIKTENDLTDTDIKSSLKGEAAEHRAISHSEDTIALAAKKVASAASKVQEQEKSEDAEVKKAEEEADKAEQEEKKVEGSVKQDEEKVAEQEAKVAEKEAEAKVAISAEDEQTSGKAREEYIWTTPDSKRKPFTPYYGPGAKAADDVTAKKSAAEAAEKKAKTAERVLADEKKKLAAEEKAKTAATAAAKAEAAKAEAEKEEADAKEEAAEKEISEVKAKESEIDAEAPAVTPAVPKKKIHAAEEAEEAVTEDTECKDCVSKLAGEQTRAEEAEAKLLAKIGPTGNADVDKALGEVKVKAAQLKAGGLFAKADLDKEVADERKEKVEETKDAASGDAVKDAAAVSVDKAKRKVDEAKVVTRAEGLKAASLKAKKLITEAGDDLENAEKASKAADGGLKLAEAFLADPSGKTAESAVEEHDKAQKDLLNVAPVERIEDLKNAEQAQESMAQENIGRMQDEEKKLELAAEHQADALKKKAEHAAEIANKEAADAEEAEEKVKEKFKAAESGPAPQENSPEIDAVIERIDKAEERARLAAEKAEKAMQLADPGADSVAEEDRQKFAKLMSDAEEAVKKAAAEGDASKLAVAKESNASIQAAVEEATEEQEKADEAEAEEKAGKISKGQEKAAEEAASKAIGHAKEIVEEAKSKESSEETTAALVGSEAVGQVASADQKVQELELEEKQAATEAAHEQEAETEKVKKAKNVALKLKDAIKSAEIAKRKEAEKEALRAEEMEEEATAEERKLDGDAAKVEEEALKPLEGLAKNDAKDVLSGLEPTDESGSDGHPDEAACPGGKCEVRTAKVEHAVEEAEARAKQVEEEMKKSDADPHMLRAEALDAQRQAMVAKLMARGNLKSYEKALLGSLNRVLSTDSVQKQAVHKVSAAVKAERAKLAALKKAVDKKQDDLEKLKEEGSKLSKLKEEYDDEQKVAKAKEDAKESTEEVIEEKEKQVSAHKEAETAWENFEKAKNDLKKAHEKVLQVEHESPTNATNTERHMLEDADALMAKSKEMELKAKADREKAAELSHINTTVSHNITEIRTFESSAHNETLESHSLKESAEIAEARAAELLKANATHDMIKEMHGMLSTIVEKLDNEALGDEEKAADDDESAQRNLQQMFTHLNSSDASQEDDIKEMEKEADEEKMKADDARRKAELLRLEALKAASEEPIANTTSTEVEHPGDAGMNNTGILIAKHQTQALMDRLEAARLRAEASLKKMASHNLTATATTTTSSLSHEELVKALKEVLNDGAGLSAEHKESLIAKLMGDSKDGWTLVNATDASTVQTVTQQTTEKEKKFSQVDSADKREKAAEAQEEAEEKKFKKDTGVETTDTDQATTTTTTTTTTEDATQKAAEAVQKAEDVADGKDPPAEPDQQDQQHQQPKESTTDNVEKEKEKKKHVDDGDDDDCMMNGNCGDADSDMSEDVTDGVDYSMMDLEESPVSTKAKAAEMKRRAMADKLRADIHMQQAQLELNEEGFATATKHEAADYDALSKARRLLKEASQEQGAFRGGRRGKMLKLSDNIAREKVDSLEDQASIDAVKARAFQDRIKAAGTHIMELEEEEKRTGGLIIGGKTVIGDSLSDASEIRSTHRAMPAHGGLKIGGKTVIGDSKMGETHEVVKTTTRHSRAHRVVSHHSNKDDSIPLVTSGRVKKFKDVKKGESTQDAIREARRMGVDQQAQHNLYSPVEPPLPPTYRELRDELGDNWVRIPRSLPIMPPQPGNREFAEFAPIPDEQGGTVFDRVMSVKRHSASSAPSKSSVAELAETTETPKVRRPAAKVPRRSGKRVRGHAVHLRRHHGRKDAEQQEDFEQALEAAASGAEGEWENMMGEGEAGMDELSPMSTQDMMDFEEQAYGF